YSAQRRPGLQGRPFPKPCKSGTSPNLPCIALSGLARCELIQPRAALRGVPLRSALGYFVAAPLVLNTTARPQYRHSALVWGSLLLFQHRRQVQIGIRWHMEEDAAAVIASVQAAHIEIVHPAELLLKRECRAVDALKPAFDGMR